jgi:hypothetical protein
MTIPPERLAQIAARHDELARRLAEPGLLREDFVALSREYAELEPVAEAARRLAALREEQANLAALAADPATDAEMRALAEAELANLAEQLPRRRWRGCYCPGTQPTSAAPSSRSAPGPAATRRRCSPATCSRCTSASPRSMAGGSSC